MSKLACIGGEVHSISCRVFKEAVPAFQYDILSFYSNVSSSSDVQSESEYFRSVVYKYSIMPPEIQAQLCIIASKALYND